MLLGIGRRINRRVLAAAPGFYGPHQSAGWRMSIVGAILFLAIYRIVIQPDDRDVMTLTAPSTDALD
jgi:hypothetical protein